MTLRMGKAKAGPVVSDNGNFIVDAPFPKEMMKDPKKVRSPASTSFRFAYIPWADPVE